MSTTALVARSMDGRDLRGVLAELLKLEHIIGGLVVAPDGLVIAANLPREVQAEPLSALAAALVRERERLRVSRQHSRGLHRAARRTARGLGLGSLRAARRARNRLSRLGGLVGPATHRIS